MDLIKLSVIFLFLLIIIPPVNALGIVGRAYDKIIYLPGTTVSSSYEVIDTSFPVVAYVDSNVFKGIKVTPIINNHFDVIIHFPEDEFVPTGIYRMAISVTEKPEELGSGIGSLVTVSKAFTIVVYSYDKDINLYFLAPSINEGNNITFALTVNSVGYKDIDSVKAKINVYDHNNNLLGSLNTPEQPLPALGSLNFNPKFDASKLPAGDYWAEAIVTYDGLQKEINSTFLIGNIDLTLNDYTKELQQGFNDFSIKVTNNWGNQLRNIYAKVFINNEELLHTPSINLDAWQPGELTGIMKIDFDPGVYQGIIKLFYEGENKEVPISVKVIAAAKPKKEFNYTLLLIASMYIVMLIVIIILIYLLLKSNKKEKNINPASVKKKIR